MHRLQITTRVVAGIGGGWVFVWGFVMLGTAALARTGMGYEDAKTLAYLLAFLVYLAALCWAFAAASALRVALLLLGGGAAMTAVALALLRLPH